MVSAMKREAKLHDDTFIKKSVYDAEMKNAAGRFRTGTEKERENKARRQLEIARAYRNNK